MSGFSSYMTDLLAGLVIVPCRLSLDTPEVQAAVPMLRGVWGAALRGLDREVYESVFVGDGSEHSRTPKYVIRPAPPDPDDSPALEWFTFGVGDMNRFNILLRAWESAADMGLGAKRSKFRIRKSRLLWPDGSLRAHCAIVPWPLRMVEWPLAGDPATTPCRLVFHAPLRLIHKGELVIKPSLADLVRAVFRRLSALLPENKTISRETMDNALELARVTPRKRGQWERLDLVRYSARQKRELDLRGVSGEIRLPEGPGELWSILVYAPWIHLGKGSTLGMGQMVVEKVS